MDKKQFFGKNGTVISRFIIVIVLFAIISVMKPGFASASHVKALMIQAVIIGVAAIGQTFVVVTGGIDMSIPWILNAAAMASFSLCAGKSTAEVLLISLVIIIAGFGIGMVSGTAVAYIGVPSIVMTLGLNTIMQGAVTGITSGSINGAAPELYKTISMGAIGPIPMALIFWIIVTAIVLVVLRKTKYGRSLYALGNSRTVTNFSGIHVKRVEAIAYGVSGATAALAGLLLLGKTGSAYLGMGTEYQFESIAAVALGGVAMSGGSGSYLGTVAGAMTISVLLSLLTALNLSTSMQQVLYGIVLFAAILIATIQNSRGKSSKL